VAPPFKTASIEIIYGEGISKIGEIIDLGVQYDIIQKSGAWFSYQDQRIGQGRENTRKYLKDHPEVTDEIDAVIRKELFAGGAAHDAAPVEAPTPDELQEDTEEDLLSMLEETGV
jgi:recombination protein RecA